jgi:hypothetical protein
VSAQLTIIYAVGPDQREYQCHIVGAHLVGICGTISLATPIVVRYDAERDADRQAHFVAAQVKALEYHHVREVETLGARPVHASPLRCRKRSQMRLRP